MLLRGACSIKIPLVATGVVAALVGSVLVGAPTTALAQTGAPPLHTPPEGPSPTTTTAPPLDATVDHRDDSRDDDWAELDDSDAKRNARLPMVVPDFSRQPSPPGADWKPPPTHSWTWRQVIGGRYNAQGLSMQLQTGYRLQLWQLPGALYEQSFVSLTGNAQLTPAFTKVGGMVAFQPLAIMNLSAAVDYVAGFGAYRFLLPLQDAAQPHDDDINQFREDNGDSLTSTGYQVTLNALLQAKVWNIAVRNRTRGFYMNMSLPAGNGAFYDTFLDVAFPNRGWVVNNDTDLLYLTDFGLRFGARYTYTRAYYEDETSTAAQVPMHRVGPALVYTFFEDPSPALYNAPTIAFLVQWWAKHRYRTGANTPAALPYLLLAFIHRGDFLTSGAP